MASYPSGMTVSSRTRTLLAEALRQRRKELGTRWRRLDPGQQALLVVAQLRNSETYAELAIGFEIAVSTAYRYVCEGLTLLAAMAPSLQQAMAVAPGKAYVVFDGSLLRIDRVAMASGNESAVLLRQAPVPRRERAGPPRSGWSPRLTGGRGLPSRRGSRARPRHPRRCWRHRLGGHRLPGRRSRGPGAASASAQGP